MAAKPPITAMEIKLALARKHSMDFFTTECNNGPTYVQTGTLMRFDAVAIRKSWTNPRITIYEVKTSRGDFLRDAKYHLYQAYCNELYIACPVGLIEKAELPQDVGLITYNPENTNNLITRKRATHRDIEISADLLWHIIMSHLQSDRLPFAKDKAEWWREWLNGKRDAQYIGNASRTKVAQELEAKSRRLEALKKCDEELSAYKEIAQMLHNAGHWVAYSPKGAVDVIRKVLESGLANGKVLDLLERTIVIGKQLEKELGTKTKTEEEVPDGR